MDAMREGGRAHPVSARAAALRSRENRTLGTKAQSAVDNTPLQGLPPRLGAPPAGLLRSLLCRFARRLQGRWSERNFPRGKRSLLIARRASRRMTQRLFPEIQRFKSQIRIWIMLATKPARQESLRMKEFAA